MSKNHLNASEELTKGLYTGYIDSNKDSIESYRPRLLVNDSKSGQKVLSNITSELKKCDEFYFSVAFITNSGVAALINVLKELEDKGIKGKILASQYQNFTEPRALKRLVTLKNIEVRIVVDKNFHAKGYIFKHNEIYTLIVGSSNLTQNALSYNQEWNLKVTSLENGEILNQTITEFNRIFNSATIVDNTWIGEYKKIYDDNIKYKTLRNPEQTVFTIGRISPNKMQTEALISIETLRSGGQNKALIISATGTGKTYLSAFDVKKYNPKRLLFVVHRENIVRASLRSYKRIFGSEKQMGILSGNQKDFNADFLFATIQTISKDDILKQFSKDYFDYIIIDEAHRSGAASFQKVLDYFNPKFLLGMTATPERTDGYDIFKAFNYNIAYEIRLNKALEENMLCTFHYYGISDIRVNGELLDENTSFNSLISDERVEHIIEKVSFYGCDHGRVKGLIFCSRINEAAELSRKLNARGYKTLSLDGSNSELEREDAIRRLETDINLSESLDYIITVDIFNEGVDIPSVNQIIMLRPTQSAIIFVQQMGRGLRKSDKKEFLTIIDFIGNYKNNFFIPIALYGDRSYNKDNLRKLINNGSSYIPGASTVNFDEITTERIFASINSVTLHNKKDLVKDYTLLKYQLGRIPTMMDFVNYGERDPFSYIIYSKSYYNFVNSIDKEHVNKLPEIQMKYLEFFSKEIGNAKRVEEPMLLMELINNRSITVSEFKDLIFQKYSYILSDDTIQSCIRILNCEFFKEQDRNNYQKIRCIDFCNNIFALSTDLVESLENECFKMYLIDILNYSIYTYTNNFSIDKFKQGFILYGKYTRKDVCKILNWQTDESSTIYGYRIKYNTCPIFVTYEKKEDIAESTKYNDQFINMHKFSWMTRSRVTMESKEVMDIKNYEKTGLRILLFVKKSDSEGSDFYYMGDMEPTYFAQTEIRNDAQDILPIVNITFSMKNPVDEKILDYLSK